MTSSIEHLPASQARRHLYVLTGSVILFLVACATPALILFRFVDLHVDRTQK